MDQLTDRSRLDDAARAGWLYFIAGNTQDEIARKLNVSRATAQRLVSLALSERLITVRLEHPIGVCMELEARLTDRFALRHCMVTPRDPGSRHPTVGCAQAAAKLLETVLRRPESQTVALGTGRMMRAAAEQIPQMDRPDHSLVSLVGNISPDGSASLFDALARLADQTRARQFPMMLPVFLASTEQRDALLSLEPVTRVRAIAARAALRLVGVGQMDEGAQVHVDGFINGAELAAMQAKGAVGEIVGWAFDASGVVIEGGSNERLSSIPLESAPDALIVGVAMGAKKTPAIAAALRGRLLNGLVTDEETARVLLETRA